MRARHIVGLGTLSVLIALTVLAYASPPDPVWVKGVYDDADYDDIVALIASGAALVEPVTPATGRPVETISQCALPMGRKPAPGPAPSANPVRAPPAS